MIRSSRGLRFSVFQADTLTQSASEDESDSSGEGVRHGPRKKATAQAETRHQASRQQEAPPEAETRPARQSSRRPSERADRRQVEFRNAQRTRPRRDAQTQVRRCRSISDAPNTTSTGQISDGLLQWLM